MKLVYESSGREVQVNDEVDMPNGLTVTVKDIQKPAHGGSTGRVYVRAPGASFNSGYYPSVIGAKWIDRDDQF